MGLPVHDLLVFPTVLVGHYKTEVFGMLVIIAQFLLSFPFLQVALYHLEPLRFFEVNPYGNLLAAYVQFNGLSLSYLLLLLCAQLDVVDFFHVFQFLLQPDIRHLAMDDRFRFWVELQVLLCLLTIDLHGFLKYFAFA